MTMPAPAAAPPARLSRTDLWFLLGLLGVLLALYLPAVAHPPVYDDGEVIARHAILTGAKPLGQVWHTDYWGFQPPRVYSYRPVAVLALALEHGLGGFAALRRGQLLWASVALVLGYAVCRRFASARASALVMACFAAGAPWSEAIFLVAARPDLMTAVAWAAGLLCVLDPRPRVAWGSLPVLALAVLSKETAFVLPAAWLLAVAALYGLSAVRARWPLWASQFVIAAVVFVIRGAVLGHATATAPVLRNPLLAREGAARAWGALEILARVQLPSLLQPFARSIDCSADTCTPASPLWSLLGALLLVGLAWLAWRLRGRPVALLSMASAFLLYLPISNLLVAAPAAYADRVWYPVALAATPSLALLLDWGLARGTRLTLALALVVLGVQGVATHLRADDWRSYTRVVEADLLRMPDNGFLAMELATLRELEGRSADARALAHLGRRHNESMRNCEIEAMAAARMGDETAALELFAACQHLPPYLDAILNYASLLAKHGRFPEALAVLDRAAPALGHPQPVTALRARVVAASAQR